MDIGGILKDNLKAFLPVLGLIIVIIAFYTVNLDSSYFTNIARVNNQVEKADEYAYGAVVETTLGSFTIELFEDLAPKNVANFVSLAEDGFYKNLRFHRVISNFIIQTGDPEGDGYGNAGYYVKDEIAKDLKFEPYVVAMANEGKKNTNSSQFFVTLSDGDFIHLDGEYTIIGKVKEGIPVVEEIGRVNVDSNFSPTREILIRNIVITKERKK